jgi:hypothetical protein
LTSGAVHEVRVAPVGPHTEIVVRTTGDVRHRLFQRLGDQRDPRLTMVLTGVGNTIVERDFAGIERGGVRSLAIAEFGADTVQIAVHLQATTAYTIFRRDDELVLRIENPDGEFRPWSSQPAVVQQPAIAQAPDAPEAIAVAVAVAVAAETSRADAGKAAEPEATAPNAPRHRLAWAEMPAGVRVAALSRAVAPYTSTLVLAALTLTILLGANRLRQRWRTREDRDQRQARRGARRSGDSARSASAGSASAGSASAGATAAPRHPTASRVWAARTLAAHGASPDEIVRKTGLARDAVRLLAPTFLEQGVPAENAGTGTFFPPTDPYGRGAPAGAAAVRH